MKGFIKKQFIRGHQIGGDSNALEDAARMSTAYLPELVADAGITGVRQLKAPSWNSTPAEQKPATSSLQS